MSNHKFQCPHCEGVILAFPKEQIAAMTLESTAPVLETGQRPSPSAPVERRTFWASDGINSVVVALFVILALLGITWWYELPGWLAVMPGILIGIALYIVRVMLHAPVSPFAPAPEPEKTIIQVEEISEDGRHWVLNDFDERITLTDLQAIARAIYVDPNNADKRVISRNSLRKQKVSKDKADLILSELKRLNYAFTTKQKRTYMTGRGRRFVYSIPPLLS